jgi:hypothetical protein
MNLWFGLFWKEGIAPKVSRICAEEQNSSASRHVWSDLYPGVSRKITCAMGILRNVDSDVPVK